MMQLEKRRKALFIQKYLRYAYYVIQNRNLRVVWVLQTFSSLTTILWKRMHSLGMVAWVNNKEGF